MKNKTCGECHFYNPKTTKNGCGMCTTGRFKGLYVDPSMKACVWSIGGSKITNGDVIRQGGNRDFAEYFVYETGAMFASTLIVDKTFDTYDEAIEATEAYLNAPAESEGEDE